MQFNSDYQKFLNFIDELREREGALREAVLRASPKLGAWESRCSFCGATTECGDIIHKTKCPISIALAGCVDPADAINLPILFTPDQVKPLVDAIKVALTNCGRWQQLIVIRDNGIDALNKGIIHAETLGIE